MTRKQWTIIGVLCAALVVVFCSACLVLSTLTGKSRPPTPTTVAEIPNTSAPEAAKPPETPRPTVVAEVPNNSAPEPTKPPEIPRATPTSVPLQFSNLEITGITYADSKVKVIGATDLPDGATLSVDFDVAGRSDADTYIGTSTHANVEKGHFAAALTPPNRPEFAKGRYVVSVLFTPRAQSEDILKAVGPNGENLDVKMDTSLPFKLIRTSREVNLSLTIVPYPMPSVTSYSVTSPERAFVEFLISWQNRDWDRMAKFTQLTWRATQTKPSQFLEDWYGLKDLLGAKIISRKTETNAVVDLTATVYYALGSEMMTKSITARVIRESSVYSPSTTGQWGVNPLSAWRED